MGRLVMQRTDSASKCVVVLEVMVSTSWFITEMSVVLSPHKLLTADISTGYKLLMGWSVMQRTAIRSGAKRDLYPR